ncbi:class I SAM-dependent methyltransferase, partial [Methylogaea oryzae]|uniref:class I SAM-dependent methyltransferase n=1 Tax=Methylogaea oryzae TaxID=1295382 RepID=UPI00138F68F9
METLSAAYAREAVRELGDAPEIPLQHRRLYARLQQIAAETADEAAAPAEQLAAALAHQHPSVAGELRVLQRCGEQLAAVLRGACDPLQLLFPGGDTGELAGLYADSTAARCMNTLLGETVAEALRGWPAERPIRILEIGAGTGASTAYLLQRLPMERVRYTFSDISPHFAAKARQRFGAYSSIDYRTLDIEHDPTAQGYDAHGFDLVVAANVLHATRDLAATLRHAGSLLAPGGLLVLLEGIAPQRWLDLIFGLTGGWWRFEDATCGRSIRCCRQPLGAKCCGTPASRKRPPCRPTTAALARRCTRRSSSPVRRLTTIKTCIGTSRPLPRNQRRRNSFSPRESRRVAEKLRLLEKAGMREVKSRDLLISPSPQ